MVDGRLLVLVARQLLCAGCTFATLFHSIDVTCVDDCFLVALEHLSGVRRVWAGCGATEASLIDIVHLLLRLHLPNVVLRIHVVVSLVTYYILWILQDLWALVVALQNHSTA